MIKRRTPIARTVPVKRKRAGKRKVSVDRNPAYLAFLRKCRCFVCVCEWLKVGMRLISSDNIVDPAHGPVNGMRSKGPDSGAIPLCRVHHDEQHRIGWPAFEAKYGFSRKKEAKAYLAVFKIWKE